MQWRMVAALLWAFRIEGEGEGNVDTDIYDEGLVKVPRPFQVGFVLRGKERGEVIREAFEKCKADLQRWE